MRAAPISGWTTTKSLKHVKQVEAFFFLSVCWHYWKHREKNYIYPHKLQSKYFKSIWKQIMGRKYFAWDLISSFCWDCISLWFGFFSLPIFRCNFLGVLNPPDAHLNLISSFSSSVTASNNTKCVHATALILYSCYSSDHLGWKLGGIFAPSHASLPLLAFQD